MKPGRPRKPGKRYQKNDRLTRAALADDVMKTAIEARMRIFSASKTAVIEREPTGECLYGFPLGRLYKIGYISKAQYTAGNTFADHLRTYMLSKGIGAATAPAFDMDRRGASLSERPVQHESEARQYMETLAEVDRLNPCGRSATAMMWEICLREGNEHFTQKEIGVFREGLNAIDRCIKMREKMRKAA
jgi:hypothetical protein